MEMLLPLKKTLPSPPMVDTPGSQSPMIRIQVGCIGLMLNAKKINCISLLDGYRSAVAYFDDNLILAAGKDSCDYSMSLDEGFVPMDGNYYAVSISKDGSTAFASGPNGNIGKLKFN